MDNTGQSETGILNYTLIDNKWVVTDKTGTGLYFGNDAAARQDDAVMQATRTMDVARNPRYQ